jgi:hypothetical protein
MSFFFVVKVTCRIHSYLGKAQLSLVVSFMSFFFCHQSYMYNSLLLGESSIKLGCKLYVIRFIVKVTCRIHSYLGKAQLSLVVSFMSFFFVVKLTCRIHSYLGKACEEVEQWPFYNQHIMDALKKFFNHEFWVRYLNLEREREREIRPFHSKHLRVNFLSNARNWHIENIVRFSWVSTT